MCFVHIATRAILTEAERDEYRRYLMRQRQAFDPLPPEPVRVSLLAHMLVGGFAGWLLWRISPPTLKGK